MHLRLDADTRRWLHASVGPAEGAFAVAVALQLLRSGGAASARAAAEGAVALLSPGGAGADRVDQLLADPPLLAAVFQNVDLLYRHASPRAEEVGGWVMAALERTSTWDDH